MILNLCDLPEALSVMRIVNIVIKIIKIVVPILLIVSAMIDLVKAVMDAELNKISKPMVNKVIAAVLIFLIPTLVSVIAEAVGNDGEYKDCLGEITIETINQAYINREEELLSKAENTNNLNDYNDARNYLVHIKDESIRDEFSSRLDVLKNKNEEPSNPSDLKTSTDYTLYLGDSRTEAYTLYKSYLGIDSNKEKIIAASATGYDEVFKSHLSDALNELKSSNVYNVTLNYGVNSLYRHTSFCNDYDSFIQKMDSKNNVYIISVTPVNDSVSQYAKNKDIEKFNSYMKDECINKLKKSNENVYYCDVYSKLSVNDWKKYIDSSGIHYTREGYKFIYDSIKSCIK